MLCTMVVASRTSNLVAEGGLFFTMATCEIICRLLIEKRNRKKIKIVKTKKSKMINQSNCITIDRKTMSRARVRKHENEPIKDMTTIRIYYIWIHVHPSVCLA